MILPQDPVQAAIVHSLNHHCDEDAIFLGERLFAEAPSDATLFLLATCYYQSGRKTQAYRFLRTQGYPTARCKYLYSRCCFDAGKLNEAESVLTNGSAKTKTIDEFASEYGDTAAFAVGLLADIYRITERHAKAMEYYEGSLKLNPFMWSSFCKICKLGGKPDAAAIFNSSHIQEALNSVKSTLLTPQTSSQKPVAAATTLLNAAETNSSSTPVHTNVLPLLSVLSASLTPPALDLTVDQDISTRRSLDRVGHPTAEHVQSVTPATVSSPSFGMLPLDTPIAGSYMGTTTPAMISSNTPGVLNIPPAPSKKTAAGKPTVPGSKLVFGQSSTSNTKSDVMVAPSLRSHSLQSSALPRRRSKRILDSQSSSSVKENSKMQTRSKYTVTKSTSRKLRSTQTVSEQEDLNSKNKLLSSRRCTESSLSVVTSQLEQLDIKQKQSAGAFLSLLKDMGSAYCLSQSYNMKAALAKYESLPRHQYHTGWVLAEVGRAYLEITDYHKAAEVFEDLLSSEPHQVNGMETYSTVLYHLQREMELSTLSQSMVALDKLTPQTWCVNGNCFSLQKEHETAIKFLQRAIQLDNNFAYAYTLLGHEYTLIEDYDKAMSAFRNAIRVDSRHYNAWYGLGMIYYKKEKFTLAETHFKKAFAINPQSAVLLCHIGLVQHALQKHDVALQTLNQAVELSPKNPLCLFHRASMLVANDMLEEALDELKALKVLTPKESLVYFLIGKVHKKLGNANLSMLNFSWATDLDPKGANNHIKEAIDRRYITDDDEDGSDQPQSDNGGLLNGRQHFDLPLSADSSVVYGEAPNVTLSTDSSIFMDSDIEPQPQANESDESF